jgi:signal transduction histidine kinase/ligand-binding sensor domain-containing protein/DNA-binding response OmpR family regulator
MITRKSTIWSIALLFILFLLSRGKTVAAQNVDYKFQFLTANDGLPQNTVDYILKDKRGFMWFGTWNGLCRYDGYGFKTYRKESEPAGLPDNFVQALCEDEKGDIWVGTRNGLAHYLFSQDHFYTPHNITSTFSNYSISHLAFDQQNRLWVATSSHGVWYIRFSSTDTIAHQLDNSLLPNRHTNEINIYQDFALVGTSEGLAVINLKTLQDSPKYKQIRNAVQGVNISSVFVDSNDNIWLGSDTGLYEYDALEDRIYYYSDQVNDPTDLNHLTVTAIAEDKLGNIIVGTLGGLNYFEPATHTFAHLSGNAEKNENLNNPFVNSILTDNEGDVWIGTDKGGVNYYNVYQKPFHSLVNNPANPNSLSHNTINSILKEKNVLWVGTAGGGLNRVTDNGKKVERFEFDVNEPGSIGSNFVTSIFRNSRQQLWMGTWGGGLNRLVSLRRRQFQTFRHNDNDSQSICSDFVSSVTELDKNGLLVGTLGGLDILNLNNNVFTHVHEKMNLTEPLEVGCILVDHHKWLWIGTQNGLYRIAASELENIAQLDSVRYHVYFNEPGDSFSLPGNYVISLHEARNGTIWIGTYGDGICKYVDEGNGEGHFVHFNEKNGLCNNVAYAMEEDLQGNLWISTDKGLSKFNPNTDEFQNFFVKDGLLSDQFYWSASDADAQGNIYFGGIAGLNYFNAADIELYRQSTTPTFTNFSVFNTPVKIGKRYHSNVILKKSIAETKQVELSYKDAVFSIEFSALDYFLPEKIKYAYKMEGVDQDWVEVQATRRFANYTNLSGGVYTFKVKATNSDGIWSDKPAELKIIVHPPFYDTAWFRVLFILFVILMVMAYIRYRTRFLKEQKRKLELQVRERTEKIEEQKETLRHQADNLRHINQELGERQKLIEGQKQALEKQNKKIGQQRDELIMLNEKVKLVNQLRLRFFTNISHEFRTPLTLIIDPVEELMKTLKGDKQTLHTLKIVNRNAQRLLHLINQLIYFRRIKSGKTDLRVSKGNLHEFLFQIFESFQDLAQHQQMNYVFGAKEAPAETWFDGEKLENILYNLLSNAFKNTPAKGNIKMEVSFVHEKTTSDFPVPHVSIKVIDSGKGIDKEHLPFIFERFYKVGEEKGANLKSSGIGLALTFELVQALHGEIKVDSEKGKGTCFEVLLPYTEGRFDKKELDQTAVPVEVNLQGKVDVLAQNMTFDAVEEELEEMVDDEEAKPKPLILIVEDNFDLRTFLTQTLRNEYRIIGAGNGKEGFALAKKYSPELIISDVMMPVMDGIELCSRLKKEIQTSHIPVILLTAKTMVENLVEGLETGADDYIPKPFNLQVLQARMKNLIEGRRKLKKMFSTTHEASVNEITNNPLDEEFLTKAYKVLEKKYIDPEFSAAQFARDMFVSRSLLYKKLKALTDQNITDFINSYKLKKAVEMMRQSNEPISDIAFRVGFNDPKYFSRIFRKFYGMSPSEFQSKK